MTDYIKELYMELNAYFREKIFVRRILQKNISDEIILECIVYSTFVFSFMLDKQGEFKSGVYLGNGKNVIMLYDEQILSTDIKTVESRQHLIHQIDEYCRLRLPDKFLNAFE